MYKKTNEQLLDQLEDYLLNDRKFRNEFFNNPIKGLESIHIKSTPEITQFLKDFNWPKVDKNVEKFNEKLVLCSSSGN